MRDDTSDRNDSIRKLGELIKDSKFAMFTTVHEDGTLRSRPMATQQVEFDGDLWFFTGLDTAKVHELETYRQVNISYSNPDNNSYVSVSGVAEVVDDMEKMKELWNPFYKAWFPQGLDDPGICLLKVHVTGAEYWDTPDSKVVQLVGFAKAIVTGKRYEPSEHKKVRLDDEPAA